MQTQEVTKLLSGEGTAIPLLKVFMSEEAIRDSSDVLRSGYIGQGPRVERFEKELANWTSSPHIVTVNSGTSAIHLALRLCGVEPGDEVITTPMTCMATNVPILGHHAKIVWGDIDPETGNLCPRSVAAKITPKTKAILCVDWAGYPCDLEALQHIADHHGIKLIEDAAHGFGARYKGRLVGGIADFTCFSFQAVKHLTTVDGGALVCKDPSAVSRAKLLRWYGIDREGKRTDMRCEVDVEEYGYKFHMNDVTAAIGLAQLNHIDTLLEKSRANARYYDGRLQNFKLHYSPEHTPSYWIYTIKVHDRDRFLKEMEIQGIAVSKVHSRNDHHTVFSAFKCSLPGVDAFAESQVSIPVGWWLTPEEREWIADHVLAYR